MGRMEIPLDNLGHCLQDHGPTGRVDFQADQVEKRLDLLLGTYSHLSWWVDVQM